MSRIALLSLVPLLLMMLSCGGRSSSETIADGERVAVRVATVEKGTLKIYRDYTGTLEGIEQADLTAKIGETIVDVRVRPGDRVRAGEIVMSFDRTGPTSRYQQAKAQFDLSDKTLMKMTKLFEEGAISEQAFDNTKAEHTVAEANFRAAREVVDVPSPIDGVVTDIAVNEGDQTFIGQKVATVSRVDSLRLTFGVDPSDLSDIDAGTAVVVYPAGDKSAGVEGVVRRVASSADPKTRAFKVEVVVRADQKLLKPGSFAGCTIPLRDIADAVFVPEPAVLLYEGIKRVYTVHGDTAQAIEITTGVSSNGFTQVLSGLANGDTVVVVGQSFLADKSAITITSGEEAGR